MHYNSVTTMYHVPGAMCHVPCATYPAACAWDEVYMYLLKKLQTTTKK